MSAGSPFDTDSAIRRLRRTRRRVAQRRRQKLTIGGAALGFAVATSLGLASFTGTDLAGAAVTRARDVMELIDARSPGARTEAQLTKMKSRQMAPPEAFAPAVHARVDLAAMLAPPAPGYVPVDVAAAPPAELLFMPPPAGAMLMPPPGGGASPPGGAGGPPGGGGGSPPGSPPLIPLVPGAVPEPGTWITMLFGFALMGWSLRRQRAAVAIGAVR